METKATKLNGIDTDGLQAMIGRVSSNAVEGKTEFRVCTQWKGGTRSETRVEDWRLSGRRLAKKHAIVADEPCELLGGDAAPNPQELLMAALNACMMVGYVAGCAMKGIKLESVDIETDGALDLRGFLGLDPSVKPGYDELRYTVRIKGDGTPEQFQAIHENVMATSPNFYNIANAIRMRPRLVVEQVNSEVLG